MEKKILLHVKAKKKASLFHVQFHVRKETADLAETQAPTFSPPDILPLI